MVRSSTSCFKIIACGSYASENDELEAQESKGSTEKRGWSFRKKSVRHRVLSDNVNVEMPHYDITEHSEVPDTGVVQPHFYKTIPDKISEPQLKNDALPYLLPVVSLKDTTSSHLAMEASCNAIHGNFAAEEHDVIVIQTAIRLCLAHRTFDQLKNVVKLQAAVRGHLVRRHAAGTLRCVHAIVKMQALVRAHQGRQSCMTNLSKKDSFSIEKLLASGFACRLLETVPRTKSMHFKCDPSRPNSAWHWLERWMAVSATEISQSVKQHYNLEMEKQIIADSSKTRTEGIYELADVTSDYAKSTMSVEGVGLGASNSEDVSLRTHAVLALGESFKISRKDDTMDKGKGSGPRQGDFVKKRPFQGSAGTCTSQCSSQQFEAVANDSDEGRKKTNYSVKRASSEQLGINGRKVIFGSINSTNHTHATVQSKMSSNATPGRSFTTYHEIVTESDVVSSLSNTVSVISDAKSRNLSPLTSSALYARRVSMDGSECGTALSVTSAFDSPEKSDIESDERLNKIRSSGVLDSEIKKPPVFVESPTSEGVRFTTKVCQKHEKLQYLEATASDMQIHHKCEMDQAIGRSSPDASITVLDSQQGTPSSQISSKGQRSGSDQSNPKKQPQVSRHRSDPSNNLSGRSAENLPKEVSNGKRRKSFDHDARATSSSISLPNYMQATESARAKVHGHLSPKSSPDVREKETYSQKRHSLPATNGKQVSPRIQRSMSQAHPNAKANDTHSCHTGGERKWQRC